MIVMLQGYARVDFVNEKGERVHGTNLFITYPDPNVSGLFAGKVFVQPNIPIPDGTTPGAELDMQFTPKGKLVSIAAVKR